MSNWRRVAIVASALSVAALARPLPALASCGGTFCAVNTQWETQGAWTGPGLRLSLRYEYSDQNQLRSGSGKAAPAGVPGTIDETRTLNRNLFAGLDYSIDPAWAVSLQLPVIQRDHSHVDNTGPTVESWNIQALGDLRLLGRYQHVLGAQSSAGLQFGLKLPTGKFDETNAGGVLAERSLQPGSGTTDALLGAYYHRRLEGDATTMFVQGLWLKPLNGRDGFEPGQQFTFDIGLRYALTLETSAMLQLNTLFKGRDQGINAEPDDSGAHYVFLSPGVSHAITRRLQVYGFVQLPVYQYVNGTQLTADWSAVAGMSWQP
jgi:hypothetical protein